MVSSHFHKNYKKQTKKHAYLFFLVSVFTLLGYGSVNWLLGALENKQKQKTYIHTHIYIYIYIYIVTSQLPPP